MNKTYIIFSFSLFVFCSCNNFEKEAEQINQCLEHTVENIYNSNRGISSQLDKAFWFENGRKGRYNYILYRADTINIKSKIILNEIDRVTNIIKENQNVNHSEMVKNLHLKIDKYNNEMISIIDDTVNNSALITSLKSLNKHEITYIQSKELLLSAMLCLRLKVNSIQSDLLRNTVTGICISSYGYESKPLPIVIESCKRENYHYEIFLACLSNFRSNNIFVNEKQIDTLNGKAYFTQIARHKPGLVFNNGIFIAYNPGTTILKNYLFNLNYTITKK